MNIRHQFRYTSMTLFFVLAGIAIIARLVQIQVGAPGEKLQEFEQIDGKEWVRLVPARGDILDRWGRLFAGNQLVYEAALELYAVENPETIALVSNLELGLNYNEVLKLAQQNPYELDPYTHITLDYFVSPEDAERVLALKEGLYSNPEQAGTSSDGEVHSLIGLVLTPRLERSYPQGSVGSNFVGFMTKEGESIHGIEEQLHWLLSGVEKEEVVSADPHLALELPEAIHGADVILTIDREIQIALEDVLDEHMEISGAFSGLVIVMDPKNGEILGMASSPRMDLGGDWKIEEIFSGNRSYNMAVDGYEPGSIFKIITMAAALDSGVVTPDTPFTDTGALPVDGWTIRNWDGGAWGPQTMTTCMEHSLNVCLAWVATAKLGENRFYDYVRRFQFDQPTGIELAREASGVVRFNNQSDWHLIDLATNSYGQGIIVTPLQMLRAVSAVANNGQMVTPHILKAVVSRDYQYTIPTEDAGSPISAETAQTLSKMLAQIVESESYTEMFPGYSVAGKTGTATIYDSNLTNASFIGWGPVDDPQFMVYVWLHKPTTSQWASLMAAPVFRDVVGRIVVLMDIPPDQVRLSLSAK